MRYVAYSLMLVLLLAGCTSDSAAYERCVQQQEQRGVSASTQSMDSLFVTYSEQSYDELVEVLASYDIRVSQRFDNSNNILVSLPDTEVIHWKCTLDQEPLVGTASYNSLSLLS